MWTKTHTPQDLVAIKETAEKLGGRWLRREVWWRIAHYLLVVTGSVLASVAGATALAKVWDGTLSGVLALLASAVTALAVALRPGVMATACAHKAAQYLCVARKAHQAQSSNEDEQKAYYRLLCEYDKIRTTPEPQLPSRS